MQISDASVLRLRNAQAADPQLARWQRALSGRPDEQTVKDAYFPHLALRDGVVLFQRSGRKGILDKNAYRIVAAPSMYNSIIEEAHSSMLGGHGGQFHTGERVKSVYWWPGMDLHIQDFLARCTTCLKVSRKNSNPPTPLQPLPETRNPSKRLHTDLYGPVKNPQGEKKYVLVMTDAFTKFTRLAIIPSKAPHIVAEAIVTEWCLVMGIPEQLFSDIGAEFGSAVAKDIWKALNINHTTTTPLSDDCVCNDVRSFGGNDG